MHSSTERVCTCEVCRMQFTPLDRRSKGLVCSKAACRTEWNKRTAINRCANHPKPEPKKRIAPLRPTLTILQPSMDAYLASMAASMTAAA